MASSEKIGANNTKRMNVQMNSIHCTTLDFMRMQPVLCEEMVAGDTFRIDIRAFARLSPMAAPVFGRARIDYHLFFVPNRLTWSEWQNYIDGNSDLSVPYINLAAIQDKYILDEWKAHDTRCVLAGLGYPTQSSIAALQKIGNLNAMPLRAYQRIWWDWYRNSEKINDIQKNQYILEGNGNQYTDANYDACVAAKYRTWDKDYLTAAFNAPQAPTGGTGIKNATTMGRIPTIIEAPAGVQRTVADGDQNARTITTGETTGENFSTQAGGNISVQAIRWANSLQRWMETNNIAGSRAIGRMLARYGTTPNPKTLDMAEFIGYTSQDVTISDVTQSEGVNGQGSYAMGNAFGVGDATQGTIKGSLSGKGWYNNTGHFEYTAEEFGYLIAIATVVPDAIYENTLPRMLMRGMSSMPNGRFDWWTPEMENVGFQPVYAYEAGVPDVEQATGDNNYLPMQVWGYTPRYEEYKHGRSFISGDFIDWATKPSMKNFVMSRNLLDATGTYDQETGGYDMDEFTIENGYAFTGVDKEEQDSRFSITEPKYDHFAIQINVHNSASRPMNSNSMPMLEDNNTGQHDVPRGGVSL